jgi:hypothetical protein
MIWTLSHRADKRALPIADRHYNRQKPGTPQFVPPGRCIVLLSRNRDALWVSSWPFAEYVKHRWPGAWVCSCFRKEGPGIASDMIRQAVAVTRSKWEPPAIGMVTFIDREEVTPIIRRGVKHWGYTYERAGFEPDGETEGGLLAFVMRPERMPEAAEPYSRQKLCFGHTE